MGRKINIRPTSSVYATYKRLTYRPWTAIAEFVDNSSQSFYDHKDALMSIKYAKGLKVEINYIKDDKIGDSIEIIDNAFGMEWEDFTRAVILDKPPLNTNGRNEFGMGLKTAACWFGSIWSVESTQYGSRNKYYTQINVDELGKYKTEEIDVVETVVSAKEHGTKIVIKQLNQRISGASTVRSIKELLGSIYREDLRTGLIQIFYNGNAVEFKEAPVYVEKKSDGKEKAWKKAVSFIVEHEGKELSVHGFVAIRIPASIKDAGFALIRRGRVIDTSFRPEEVFGPSNHFAYQRMYGELHMDSWPVTQAKDGFNWHSGGLLEKFIEKLIQVTRDYRQKSETIRLRDRVNTKDVAQKVVDSLTASGIIDNVEVSVANNQEETPTATTKEVEVDNTRTNVESSNNASEEVIENDDSVVFEGGSSITMKFNHESKEYKFEIELDMSSPASSWLLVENTGLDAYRLVINMRHAFFKPFISDKDFMGTLMKLSVAMAIAEIDALKVSPDGRIEAGEIRNRMNSILELLK